MGSQRQYFVKNKKKYYRKTRKIDRGTGHGIVKI